MEKKFKLVLPKPINFISLMMPPRPRQDGFNPAPSISVGDLTEEEATEYAECLKQDFLRHWRERSSKPASNGE